MNRFHFRCLRNLLHIRWQDTEVPDTEVLKQPDILSVITTMRKAQLRWAGHVSLMSNTRIPKQLFYGELSQAQRQSDGRRNATKTVSKSPSKTSLSTQRQGRRLV